MAPSIEPQLSATILTLMYMGDVVFAVSGALNAARPRMGTHPRPVDGAHGLVDARPLRAAVVCGRRTGDLFFHYNGHFDA